MPERFGRNTVTSMALSVVLLAVALLTTPLLTRHLGHQRYGIWVLVVSIVQYLELLELGFSGATVTAIARHNAAGDRQSLERTVNTTFFTLVPLGVFALLVSIGLAVVLPSLIHVSPSLVSTTRWLVLLLGLDIVVSIPMDTFGGGLVAIHRFDILNATLIAVAVARAVAWTLVLVFGGSLVMLGIVTVVIGLCGQLARALCFAHLVPGLKVHPRHFEREVLRSLARPAGWFAVGGFVTNFRDYARIFLLGVVKGVVDLRHFRRGGDARPPRSEGARSRHPAVLPSRGRLGGPAGGSRIVRGNAHRQPHRGGDDGAVLPRGRRPRPSCHRGLGRSHLCRRCGRRHPPRHCVRS